MIFAEENLGPLLDYIAILEAQLEICNVDDAVAVIIDLLDLDRKDAEKLYFTAKAACKEVEDALHYSNRA